MDSVAGAVTILCGIIAIVTAYAKLVSHIKNKSVFYIFRDKTRCDKKGPCEFVLATKHPGIKINSVKLSKWEQKKTLAHSSVSGYRKREYVCKHDVNYIGNSPFRLTSNENEIYCSCATIEYTVNSESKEFNIGKLHFAFLRMMSFFKVIDNEKENKQEINQEANTQ